MTEKDTKALKIVNLEHKYDKELALCDISIEIEKGEKIAIIGPNGAGKTTLFLHMNGTFKSKKNTIFINGKDITEMNIKERIRNVGVVFADPDDQLFMPSVYDDIAFGPNNLGLKNEEVEERVKDAVEMMGIKDLIDKVPHHLSMGQKKKVALASVLSLRPKILILDEPTANLDPKSKKDIMNIIKRLNDKGITTIISTHDINLLPNLADKIYLLNKRILKVGTPEEVFEEEDLLNKNNLEAPEIYKLFKEIKKLNLGIEYEKIPVTFDEAIEIVKKSV